MTDHITRDTFEKLFIEATQYAELGNFQQALKLYSKAYTLNPNSYELLWNVGIINEEFNKFSEAIKLYEKVLSLEPNAEYLLGSLILAKLRICDWFNLEQYLGDLKIKLAQGKKVCRPFELTALIDSPQLQLQAATTYNLDAYPQKNIPSPTYIKKGNRIKLGYFSADFHNHPTTYLVASLFESHDKDKFELYGFSFGENYSDSGRQRIQDAFEHFFDVRDNSDEEIANMAKDLQIDIAIDLKGYTKDMRMGIFSYRPAPIQVNYLGFPGTIGSKYYDYIIADKTLIPESNQKFYSERIVYLPNSYQINDTLNGITNTPSRSKFGLPSKGFIFCCFNNNYKISPQIFTSWCKILLNVPNS